MTSKIALVLEVLGDGKWHRLEDLQHQMDLTSDELGEIADFLGVYGFAEVDESKNRVKINRAFKKILAQKLA